MTRRKPLLTPVPSPHRWPVNFGKWLRKWWLRGWRQTEAILTALLETSEESIGAALAGLSRTVRHQRPTALRRRFLPTLEELEPRYVLNVPVITGMTPDVGPITGGAAVTLTGSGFTGTTAVAFGNGHPAGFVVLSDTTLQVTSPTESTGVVDILVTNASGQSTPTTADEYTYTNQPSITAVSPNQGSTDGGNSVTISGLNLNSATSVMFGDLPATSFTDSKGQITATAPAETAGLVDVQVVTVNGTTPISAADQYTYVVPAPVITGVSPNSGSAHGGQQVTLTGTDFSNASQVSFGGTPAVNFNVVSATQIIATAPPETAGTVDVTVTTPGGTSAVSTADDFSYAVPAPVITSVNPGSASTDGGTPIVLTGTDLSGATQVMFGTTTATSFTAVSPSEIMATAPAGMPGMVDVTVTTAAGTSALSAADQLTYVVPAPVITSLSSSSGSTAGGEQVTITGTDLGGASAVFFGTVQATSFQQVSATEITALAPAGLAGTVDVRVTTAGGTSAVHLVDQFQFVSPPPASTLPTVTGISSSQDASGGTDIIITGTNFTGATQVLFGKTAATSFTVDSDTQITAVAPALAAGAHVSVMVQTPAGNSAPSTTASYIVASTGSGGGGSAILTLAPMPSSGSASGPMSNAPFAPRIASSPYIPGIGGGDGAGSAPTTAVSSSAWNTPGDSSNTNYTKSGGGGHSSYSDSWGYHYQMTVKLDGNVISSYTASGGGSSHSSSTWSDDSGTSSTSETTWSNDSYFQNFVTTVSNGTKGSSWDTTTTTNKSSGKDQTKSNSNFSSSWGPSSSSDTGNSTNTATGTSTNSNTSHGNYSSAITGGNSTGQWQAGSTAHNGYTNTANSSFGSNGIWMSSGSMSNHGSGTSYSSLSSKYGYTLTNSGIPSGSSTNTGSGQYAAKENGAWSSHQTQSYGQAGNHWKGSQTSNSNGTSNSTSQTKSSGHDTTADGKTADNGAHNFSGKGSNSFSGSGSLGSDGIWVNSGSVQTKHSGVGKSSDSDDGSFDTKSASGSSSLTGAGNSTSSSTSGSSTSSTGSSKLNNGMWTPVSGKTFSSDSGKSSDTGSDGGQNKAVLVGDKLSGPWSITDSGNSNFSTTVKSVLNANGLWVTTGAATEGGSAKGSDSDKESDTESLTSSGGADTTKGSLTIKEADSGKDGDHYSGKETMTQGGGWVTVSGTASSTSGSTSNSSTSDAGTSSATTAAGDSRDNFSAKGSDTASFSDQVNAKLGSDGVWVTTGSVTVKGSGSGGDTFSDKDKYQVDGDGGSSSGSPSNIGSPSSLSGSSNGWATGSDTGTSGSSSGSTSSFNAQYSLGATGSWNAVSGSATAKDTSSSKDSLTGKGDLGSTLTGGSDDGTWNSGGSDQSSNTATVTSTLGSGGTWTTTGTDTGSDSGSWSSASQGSGAFSIDTGTTGSGNWDDTSGTVTASSSDKGNSSDNYQFSLDTSGNWDPVSGSASASDTDTDDVSDDETDPYGEDTSGGEVSGTNSENDSLDITATANDGWTLGTDGTWVQSSSSSNATETESDTLDDDFSGGNIQNGSSQDALQETLTSSNGGTPTATALTETASGSFTANGTPATFSINVSGSNPTTTISETNTTDLNGLSSLSTDDLDSLDNAIVTAIASASAGNSMTALSSLTPTYNSSGDLVGETLTDSDGDSTAWTFNSAGQLTSRTLAYGTSQAATTTFGYDANGNLISVTDPDGNVTTYTYNAQNEETSMTDPLGNTQTMEYNTQGQLIQQTNRDGMYETYAYSSAGQMVQENWYAADGTQTDQLNFRYNTAGQLVSAGNDEGTYTFSYNTQGQVIGVSEPFGVSLTFAYDSNGNRVEVQDSFGGTTQSSYDAANQLVNELFSEDGQPVLSIGEDYNADGTVANLTYSNDADGSDVVATTAYGYDNYGNVTSIVQTSGSGTILGDYTYSYDTSGDELPTITAPNSSTTPSGTAALLAAFLQPPQPGGSVTSETDNGVTTSYSYDASNQLVSYGGTTRSYDLNGNPTGPGYVIGPDNQLLSDGTYNYTYDADGNEATKTNIATGDTWTYGYNNADQLVSAVETTAGGVVETQVAIQYDVFGNRLQESVWTPSSGWTTTRYAYDAWDPATPSGVGNENWKVWATLDGNNDLVTRYINGDALDQVFAQISGGGSVAWYLTDRLGSTRALVDNNGNVLDAITYNVWGEITSQSNAAWQPSLMYAGMVYDATLGLNLSGNGEREEDPKTGRFNEEDETQFHAGLSNLYCYVGNDPTNAVDPSGLEADPPDEYELMADIYDLLNKVDTDELFDYTVNEIVSEVADKLGLEPQQVADEVIAQLDSLHYFGPKVTQKDIANITAQCMQDFPTASDEGTTVGEALSQVPQEVKRLVVYVLLFDLENLIPGPEVAAFRIFAKAKGFQVVKKGSKWVLQKVLRVANGEIKAAEKTLAKEGKALYNEYKASKSIEMQPYGGPGGGHHVPPKKMFEGASGYNKNTALAIPNNVMKELGISHPRVTGAQSSLYSAFAKTGKALTWDVVEEIETKALIAGGANAEQSLATVRKAIQSLKDAGVSPTKIPWGG